MTKKIHKEWEGKGFTKDQINEIEEGLRAGLPVELYARPEYDWFQMEEIRGSLLQLAANAGDSSGYGAGNRYVRL